MATGIYLVDNPPRTQQFRCPRRERPSGVIGMHTAESIADEVGPDTGAENVADFIRRRTNYGSYHLLCDSDSIIQLVEFRCVAYHIGTYGLNEHTIGVSAAVQASRWNEVSDDWEDATLRNMARASARAARWVKRNYGIDIPARKLTLTQARNKVPGFIAHGDADPDRRTDPDGPNNEFKWSRFLNYYAAEMAGELEDDMPLTDTDVEKIWSYFIDKVDPTSGTTSRMRASSFLSWIHHHVVGTKAAVTTPWQNPVTGDDVSPRTAWKWGHLRSTESVQLLTAMQPLMEAAARGKGMSDEQVAQIAQAVAAAVPEGLAEEVVDEFTERLRAHDDQAADDA